MSYSNKSKIETIHVHEVDSQDVTRKIEAGTISETIYAIALDFSHSPSCFRFQGRLPRWKHEYPRTVPSLRNSSCIG